MKLKKIGEKDMLALRRNQDWLPSVFNDIFDNNFYERVNVNPTTPAVNVLEKEHSYVVEVAAPGMTKEDFKVNLDEDENLVIALEKEQKQEKGEAEKVHYLRREFTYTRFRQTMILPENVDKKAITAKVENGVLTVDLPKLDPKELKKETKFIDIQ